MRNSNVNKGKKLSKSELKMIQGGLGTYPCAPNGYCKYIGPGCREEKCQLPVPLEPIDPDGPIVLPEPGSL
ncbi:hypothetical protein H3Z85_20870 [Chryseobacterium indologenes]|uniref:Bacteriocin n=2 Tax=Chryseobacterium indologenes TaxID=253 RepID=A0AAD0YTP2_CHRID|nr:MULTISPECIES: hypothetical protein [Chryseobacterium]ASE61494.1 hypothetical protein CEQ15_08320 [Chryseobacterium indologenes]ATN05578.1 hypothetical protein CRN76_09280 [Chryseobacterium indologenes]AYY85661.1 hypothetical protein EGX91_14450 [Chryseobacterium indologenes]AYZ35428.1 hypothetical protein EGY07_07525 [Chryseobacterium indologenes]AZB17165.1 hypothetical protein EG352_04975 [Chryseobacterium indologenes]